MTDRLAKNLLLLQLLALLAGTQMPGAWRAAALTELGLGGGISSWAHFVLFGGMAALAYARPLAWPLVRVVLVALGLALLTEGLQFFAQDRHPRWLDVDIDMAGAAAGLLVVTLARMARALRARLKFVLKSAPYDASD